MFLFVFDAHFDFILEQFWKPSSLLYSFLGARVAETGSKKQQLKKSCGQVEMRCYGRGPGPS